MPKLKCIKDNEGYWTVGEVYPSTAGDGEFVHIADDGDIDSEWQLLPLDYAEDDETVLSYQMCGLDAQFEVVPE